MSPRRLLLLNSSSFFWPWRLRLRLDVMMFVCTLLIDSSYRLQQAQAFQVGRSWVGDSAVSIHTEFFPQTTQPDTFTSSTNENNKNHNGVLLKPLSTDPLLLVSAQPVLPPEECHLLADYFQNQRQEGQGVQVLQALQDRLDQLICRPPQDCHDRVQPRFLSYEPDLDASPKDAVQWLLPDGLHVDTNNGKFFRYLTVLVYLTSSSSAATNFPLARTSNLSAGTINGNKDDELLLEASRALLHANVQHTRADYNDDCHYDDDDDDESHDSDDKCPRTLLLEQAAWETYCNMDSIRGDNGQNQQEMTGLRVLPRQGHITVFASIDPTSGMANPRSWHGAEVLEPGDKKELLSFFYEIPVGEFADQKTLGQAVSRRLNLLKDKYVHHVPAVGAAESKHKHPISLPELEALVVQ